MACFLWCARFLNFFMPAGVFSPFFSANLYFCRARYPKSYNVHHKSYLFTSFKVYIVGTPNNNFLRESNIFWTRYKKIHVLRLHLAHNNSILRTTYSSCKRFFVLPISFTVAKNLWRALSFSQRDAVVRRKTETMYFSLDCDPRQFI